MYKKCFLSCIKKHFKNATNCFFAEILGLEVGGSELAAFKRLFENLGCSGTIG